MRAGVILGNNGLVGRRNNLTGRNERRRDGFCTGHPTHIVQICGDYNTIAIDSSLFRCRYNDFVVVWSFFVKKRGALP